MISLSLLLVPVILGLGICKGKLKHQVSFFVFTNSSSVTTYSDL